MLSTLLLQAGQEFGKYYYQAQGYTGNCDSLFSVEDMHCKIVGPLPKGAGGVSTWILKAMMSCEDAVAAIAFSLAGRDPRMPLQGYVAGH
jgi:hypothetical protein